MPRNAILNKGTYDVKVDHSFSLFCVLVALLVVIFGPPVDFQFRIDPNKNDPFVRALVFGFCTLVALFIRA